MHFPVDNPYQITTLFGWVKGYPLHTEGYPGAPPKPGPGFGYHIGVDLVSENRRVYLAETANIEVVPWNGTSAEGNAVYYTIGGKRAAYCHLASFAPGLKNRVAGEGTYLGQMGATGAATGVHLHYSIKVNGVMVDPLEQFKQEKEMIKTEEDNRQLFLDVVGRNPLPQEVGRYVGWELQKAREDIRQNADRQNINKMMDAYYKNGSVIPPIEVEPITEQLYRKI